MPIARRTDSNQKQIVEALRRVGCSVFPTHELGKGFPDLAVGKGKRNFLFELKDGSLVKSRKKLTPLEQRFKDSWRGEVHTVETVDQAIDIVSQIPNRL